MLWADISFFLSESSGEIQKGIYNFTQNAEFKDFISPEALRKRARKKSRFILAWQSGKTKLAGVLEQQLDGFISLLFIHPERRRMGVGTELVKECLKDREENPYLFASPESLVFYLKMGFRFSAPAISMGKFSAYPMIFTNF